MFVSYAFTIALTAKECPLCRFKLASRRASKPDVNFDLCVGLFGQSDSLVGPGEYLAISPTYLSDGISKPWTQSSDFNLGSSQTDRLDLGVYRRAHQEKVRSFKKRQLESSSSCNSPREQPRSSAQSSHENNSISGHYKITFRLTPAPGSGDSVRSPLLNGCFVMLLTIHRRVSICTGICLEEAFSDHRLELHRGRREAVPAAAGRVLGPRDQRR